MEKSTTIKPTVEFTDFIFKLKGASGEQVKLEVAAIGQRASGKTRSIDMVRNMLAADPNVSDLWETVRHPLPSSKPKLVWIRA